MGQSPENKENMLNSENQGTQKLNVEPKFSKKAIEKIQHRPENAEKKKGKRVEKMRGVSEIKRGDLMKKKNS